MGLSCWSNFRGLIAAAALTALVLPGCASEIEQVEVTPTVRLINRTSSQDIGEIGFGDSFGTCQQV